VKQDAEPQFATFTLKSLPQDGTRLGITYRGNQEVIRFDEDRVERYETWMRPCFCEYVRRVAQYWPESRDPLRWQLADIDWVGIEDILASADKLAPAQGRHPETSAHSKATQGAPVPQGEVRFTRTRRNRADLFKELKEREPDLTQGALAIKAEDEARRRIKTVIEDKHPNWLQDRVNNETDRIFEETYGDVKWNAAAVENDWKEMRKAGEVDLFKEHGRNDLEDS
jgi:hypothetical protein